MKNWWGGNTMNFKKRILLFTQKGKMSKKWARGDTSHNKEKVKRCNN
jgi:hypothetical protein